MTTLITEVRDTLESFNIGFCGTCRSCMVWRISEKLWAVGIQTIRAQDAVTLDEAVAYIVANSAKALRANADAAARWGKGTMITAR